MSTVDYEHKKIKSAPKQMVSDSISIQQKVLRTSEEVAKLVGSTLGPNGKTVIIERNETGLMPITTKDGVTVAKAICYNDPVKQSILEIFRQSAMQTVGLAGDGTTSSTILAYSILREMQTYLKNNPQESPQGVLRRLQSKVHNELSAYIKENAVKTDLKDSIDLLKKVALVSSNNDEELSKAVLEAFKMVGENGFISITEDYGESSYSVHKVKGFTLDKGYLDFLGNISAEFINDLDNQTICLSNCKFLIIDGKLKDIQLIRHVLMALEVKAENDKKPLNLALVTHGFTQDVLTFLAKVFKQNGMVKIVPAVSEVGMIPNSQYECLKDVSAYSGAKLFSPLTDSFKGFKFEDIGTVDNLTLEISGYKTVIYGSGSEDSILKRIDELENRFPKEAKAIQLRLQEKIGKLSGGVAKIVVRSYSDSMNREMKDRCEDAILAVKSSLKEGVVPGGTRMLIDLASLCSADTDPAVSTILGTALLEPFMVLLTNCGLTGEQINEIYSALLSDNKMVYDARQYKLVSPFENNIYDAAAAVLGALNTSVEIATTLSSIGGIIVFQRDEFAENEFSQNEIKAREAIR